MGAKGRRDEPPGMTSGGDRYRGRMSLRRILLLLLVIGAVVAVRQATADRGGSYDPTQPA
jgi:hypothetical protein